MHLTITELPDGGRSFEAHTIEGRRVLDAMDRVTATHKVLEAGTSAEATAALVVAEREFVNALHALRED